MIDLLGEWQDSRHIKAVFDVMATRNYIDFVVLTKRIDWAAQWLSQYVTSNGHPLISTGYAPQNIIIGTSVENQKRADERRQPLQVISQLGFRTLVSYEPALGMVDWGKGNWNFLNWLICGGESGNKARPMNPDWARAARDFAYIQDIPFFFKQWGEWRPVNDLVRVGIQTFKNKPQLVDDVMMVKIGKALAGHELDRTRWRQVIK